MRLIDVDKLNFEKQIYSKSQFDAILDFIDKQPTSYDVEKVVAELEESCNLYPSKYHDKIMIKGVEIDKAIEIVRNGGKE